MENPFSRFRSDEDMTNDLHESINSIVNTRPRPSPRHEEVRNLSLSPSSPPAPRDIQVPREESFQIHMPSIKLNWSTILIVIVFIIMAYMIIKLYLKQAQLEAMLKSLLMRGNGLYFA